MKIYKTKLGLLIVEQKNNVDPRGSLREIFNKKLGVITLFLITALNRKNSLRGFFHFINSTSQVCKCS